MATPTTRFGDGSIGPIDATTATSRVAREPIKKRSTRDDVFLAGLGVGQGYGVRGYGGRDLLRATGAITGGPPRPSWLPELY